MAAWTRSHSATFPACAPCLCIFFVIDPYINPSETGLRKVPHLVSTNIRAPESIYTGGLGNSVKLTDVDIPEASLANTLVLPKASLE